MGDRYTASISGATLVASTEKTLVQVKASSAARCRVVAFAVSFEGIAATDEPVLVQVRRQSTAGTGGGSHTAAPHDAAAPAFAGTCLTGIWATTEPTNGVVLATAYVHPQSGWHVILDEPFVLAADGRLAITATADDGVDAAAFLIIDA